MSRTMDVEVKVWRQNSPKEKGVFVNYLVEEISPDMSLLEMLDVLNEKLVREGLIPIAFDHDCREGICGCCSLVINGIPHGPSEEKTTCELYMRDFVDGETIIIEPFRAKGFPIIKDLIVDREAFDKIIAAGGFISVNTGNAPEANSTRVTNEDAELALDSALCIGCGACVGACKNASAMLFVAGKAAHLNRLPQGKEEANERVLSMVKKMDELGFGNCTNEKECEAVCPKGVKMENIARLNRDFLKASFFKRGK